MCGLLALGILLLEGPAVFLPSAAAYILLPVAASLVLLTAAMLRGSRRAWPATCAVIGGLFLIPVGRVVSGGLGSRGSTESGHAVAFVLPGPMDTLLWYLAGYAAAFLLTGGGAIAALVMLLLPTTRADLRARAHTSEGPRSRG